MWIVFAILSSLIFGTASVLMKSATLKNCPDQYILWGLYFTGSLFLGCQAFSEIELVYNFNLFLWSFLIAFGSFCGNLFVIKALEIGSASLTASMLNINLPFIILMSVFIYGEEINAIKLLIILFLFVAILLVKIDPDEKLEIKDNKWFIWIILGSTFLFLREGGLKITQELKLNNIQVLFYSYVLCFLLSSLLIYKKEFLFSKNKNEIENSEVKKKFDFLKDKNKINGIYFGLVTGLCSGVGLYFYTKSLLIGPTSLVALIFSARSLIIVLLSYFFHKERLSLFQKISVLLLCLGLSIASFI